MLGNKREFIIGELMVQGFIEHENQEMILVEKEETGKSELRVHLQSKDNLCIANADEKKTELLFFQPDKVKSMYKRVDHIIFEHQCDPKWKLYLIEMKSSVGEKKWGEIKGKFRASYLLAKAIAGMLELEISETVMYTKYEKVQFTLQDTMPTARRGKLGSRFVRMEQEWDGGAFGLNFGERVSFVHIPVQMVRKENGVLAGDLFEEAGR